MAPNPQMIKPKRHSFWIQALLILSCVALIATATPNKGPTKAPAKLKTKQPAKDNVKDEAEGEQAPVAADANVEITMETARIWSEVYSLPTEGYEIIAKLKPPPCKNLAMPAVLVPAVDMAGCMGKNVLKQIVPAYADNGADILGMGYVREYGAQSSDETANSWFRVVSKWQDNHVWQGVYKACSIEVVGEPYIGITMSTGTWLPGEYKPNQWASHTVYFARTCA